MSLNCAYCSAALASTVNPTVRCNRCGAVHHSDGTVISPRMLAIPADDAWRASPWMFAHTRPVEVGMYECRFRDVDPVLTLYWNGRNFMQVVIDKPVRCETLTSWRGQWAS